MTSTTKSNRSICVCRIAMWLIAHVALCIGSAQAEMIVPTESTHAHWIFDSPLMMTEEIFGAGMNATNMTDGNCQICIHVDPMPPEIPLIGLRIPASSHGTNAGSNSSNIDEVFASNAILCWLSDLPSLTLVSPLDAVEDLDIPPAPPFELLRPPQLLTILA